MSMVMRAEKTALHDRNAAYAIISAVASVVPASRWTFARISISGRLGPMFGSGTHEGGAVLLHDEFERLGQVPRGPRISAAVGPSFNAITLLFADAQRNYGILTLSRAVEVGPFSSPEISILTLTLEAVTEELSNLRLQPRALEAVESLAELRPSLPIESEGAFYVLDEDFRIALTWNTSGQYGSSSGFSISPGDRLPSIIEQTARKLTTASPTGEYRQGVARPVSFLVVRAHPMVGLAGRYTGVRIERYKQPNSLTAMAARFHISPREVQVLSLILDGDRLHQIAKCLYITSSTVQDHVKSMLDKTESRNRSELIARVLGWQFRQLPSTA